MRLRKILAAVLATVVMLPMIRVNDVEAASDLQISFYFGSAMASYLTNNSEINPNNDDRLTSSELQNVTEINIPAEVCANLYTKDIQALKYFPNLKTLRFNNSGSNLKFVYLNDFPSIEDVEFYGSNVTYVSLIGCTKLQHLDISSNTGVTGLNISECPNLNNLNIANTGIATIYVANNPLLADAYLNNQYQVSGPWYGYGHGSNVLVTNAATTIVTTPYTDGVPLDSTRFPNKSMRSEIAEYYDINHDGFLQQSEIDGCRELAINPTDGIVDADVLGIFTNVEKIYMSANVNSLNLSSFTNLKELYLGVSPGLTSLDISHNPNLERLRISDTGITDLYIQNNPTLVYIMSNTIPQVANEGTSSEYVYYQVNGGTVIMLPRNCQVHFDAASPEPTPTVFPLPSNTPNGVLQFCERLYTVVLDRECDISGRNYWAASVMSGTTGADAAHSFFFSDEYLARETSSFAFVNDLYRTFMNRIASDPEILYWSSLIDNGTSREDVFLGFVSCPEWKNICQEYGINPGGNPVRVPLTIQSFVQRMYWNALSRELDGPGLEYWDSLLRQRQITGTEFAHSFFFSEEFLSHNYNESEFLERLYAAFVGREGDSDGRQYWLNALSAGATREDVFNAFSTSPEFVALCQEAGINP